MKIHPAYFKKSFNNNMLLGIWLISLLMFTTAGCTLGGETDCSVGVFVVNNFEDISDDACTDEHCTLREAIQAVNTCPARDLTAIELPAGIFTLSLRGPEDDRGDLNIKHNTSIIGDSMHTTIIEGQSTWIYRLFTIDEGVELSLLNLTLQGGDVTGDGGAVYNQGTFVPTNVRIAGNVASGNGGALYSSGVAILTNVEMVGNNGYLFGSDKCGGGIYSSGVLTIIDSLIRSNDASGGHGICSVGGGRLTVTGSNISNNGLLSRTGTAFGGGIYSSGAEVTIEATTIDNNRAANGGGLYANFDTENVILRGVTVSNNRARSAVGREGDISFGLGGGLHLGSADYTVEDSLIIDNTADEQGGGIYAYSDPARPDTIQRTAIARNTARKGGGLYMLSGDVRFTNVTISSNNAGSGSAAYGASIGTLRVLFNYSTIANNGSAIPGIFGIFSGPSAIFQERGLRDVWTFHNTLVAANTVVDCSGPGAAFISAGNNYAESTACNLTRADDLDSSTPLASLALSILLEVDGTLVHMPAPFSPLVDFIALADCISEDQRPVSRPQLDGCDIGAVEIDPSFMRISYEGDITEDTLCFSGPGAEYQTVSSLASGITVQLLGIGAQAGWLVIDNPRFEGVACWLPEEDIEVPPDLDLSKLPEFPIPAILVVPTVTEEPSSSGGSDPNAPAAPSGLQVNTVCQGQTYNVQLSWNDNSDDEAGFRIYRDGSLIGTVGANSTEFTDTSPPGSGPYNYSVRASNSAGESSAISASDSGCIF